MAGEIGDYCGIDFIGGGLGAVDKIDGAVLQDKDHFLVVTPTVFAPLSLDDDSGAGEDSPRVIAPNTNPGDKRWLLTGGVFKNLSLYGVDSSILSGPHLNFRTNTDSYPVMQIMNYAHDNVAIGFDSYFDGVHKSSDAGSNARIQKALDTLRFRYDSGVAQGAAITWKDALVIDLATGRTSFGPGGTFNAFLNVQGNGDNQRIAEFIGLDEAFNRIVVDGPADADSQLSFMNGASTKWSIGNNADNNAFSIAVGHAAFGVSDKLTITTGGLIGVNNPGPVSRLDVGGGINTTLHFMVDAIKVLGNQGATVADATDPATTMARLNDLLARCRAHGLIAT